VKFYLPKFTYFELFIPFYYFWFFVPNLPILPFLWKFSIKNAIKLKIFELKFEKLDKIFEKFLNRSRKLAFLAFQLLKILKA